jgi:(4S)-4-hydroxy-5-phosphonooxypentane-2,3-dione isomerase
MSRKTLHSCVADVAAVPESYLLTRRRALCGMLAGSATVLAGEKALAGGSKQRSDAVVYKIVTIQVPPESMERFLAISLTNAAASRKEPGVLGFDVLIPEDAANTVMFIETYRSAAASDSHMRSAHFLAFKEGAKQTGAREIVVVAKPYAPK